MKYHKSGDNVSTYQSHFRAEDGIQQNSRWRALYEGILVPFGFILALVLVVFVVMLIRY
jgi:hypothetical protein